MLPLAKALRTFGVLIDDTPINRASDALCLQGKNLKNSGNYYIYNVADALQEDGSLRPDIHPGQREIVDKVNNQIRKINAARLAEHQEKLEKDAKTPAPNLLKEFGAADPGQRADKWQILNRTLLDQLLKEHRDQDNFSVYKNMPAAVAQQIVTELIESWSSYFRGNEAYKANPARFTGKPRPPGYLERDGRTTVSFPAQVMPGARRKSGNGQPEHFISLKDMTVYCRYDKKEQLSEAEKKAFNDYDLGKTLDAIRCNAGLPAGAKVSEIRLVPMPENKVKLEAVFNWPLNLDPNSFAGKKYAELEKAIEAENQAKIDAGKKVREPNAATINARLKELLREIKFEDLPRMASGDMGTNNIITIGYSTGHPGMVVSNRRIEHKLRVVDEKIDALRAALVNENPKLKALLDRQLKKDKLTAEEKQAIREGMRAVNTHPQMKALYAAKDRWLSDALHKISAGIVKELKRLGIEVFVIGLNELWKQACNMGRWQNRRFYNAPHTRLLELLKYKCLAAGILVVTNEESYTSKTSFALDEPLQTFGQKAATSTERTETEPTQGDAPPASVEDRQAVQLCGKRGTGAKRHFFKSPGADDGWQTIHADLNGAYNILRKVFKYFRHHAGLSSRFRLAWLSPKEGLSRMRLKQATT